MKKSLFAALSVIALLGGCKAKESSVAPASAAESTSAVASVETSSAEFVADPYDAVIEGLDKSKAGAYTSGNLNGYAEGSVAYGWCEYTVEAWYSTYGCAVKITFDEDNKVTDVVLGQATEGAHNFTASYAKAAGADAYANYLANSLANIKAALVGKDALDLAHALSGAKVRVADDYATTYDADFIAVDGFKFAGAGATQTDARTDVALLNALSAYVKEHIADYEPYSGTFAELEIADSDIAADGTVLYGAWASDDNKTFIGYDAYKSYGSVYGSAVKITIDTEDEDKIVSVELGAPIAGARNFTPTYAASHAGIFYNYVHNLKTIVEGKLLGKKISEELISSFEGADVKAFTGAVELLGAGATQTDTRVTAAIWKALTAYQA